MTVSVLLPVYNAGPALGRAIESILAQDDPDFELILIDDGSTDVSRELIRDYARRDERIRPVLHERNMGLAGTLNEGIELASNPLVARMDQDDESLPNRLRVQAAFMERRPGVAVAGSWVYHMGAKRRFDRLVEFPTEPDQIRAQLPRENCIYHPSVMFRRDEILALGGYRPEFKNAEDYDLWLRVSKVHDLAVIPEPLLRYRFSVHGMTLSRKWEQLYFVYLAQAANADDEVPLDEARRAAEKELAETDREWFLVQSATGTMTELGVLRFWRDAATLGMRLVRDVGVRRAGRAFTEVVRFWARVGAGKVRRRLAAAR
jgi:glycosyltransferase involved in cell wall biosynthesis